MVGWLLMQAAALLEDSMHLPSWFDSAVTGALLLGFPVAMLLTWAFEMTPEGVKRTEDLVAGEAANPGRKMDLVIIAGMAAILGLGGYQQMTKPNVVYAHKNEPAIAQDGETPLAPIADTEKEVVAASIAVLPFADLSPARDQGYFTDGMSEEILNVLVRVEGLKVASRTSAFAYKGSAQRLPEIAAELGVRHILEGSVRRSGESIRVTAQLIDAKTDEHLLSDTFDRTLTAENIFAIQGDIAQLIVTALSKRLETPTLAETIAINADTASLSTLDLYYEANALFIERGRENLTRAIDLYEQITQKDPDFARGWEGLSMVYSVAETWGLAPRDYAALTQFAAARAIALNPELSSPYAALASLERMRSNPDWFAVRANFDRALQLDPNDPNIYNWRGLFWENAGFMERAMADYDRCLELEPSYFNCAVNKHFMLVATGKDNEARLLNRSLLLAGFKVQMTNTPLIIRLADEGDDIGLLIALNEIMNIDYPNQGWVVKDLYAALTDPNFSHAERKKSFDARLVAVGLNVVAGATTQDTINIAFRDFDGLFANSVGSTYYALANSPLLGEIPKELKRQVIAKSGLPVFWREYGFPPQCKPVGADDFICE